MLLLNATPNMLLNIEMPNHEQCQIQLNLNKQIKNDNYYEKYSAECLSNKGDLK